VALGAFYARRARRLLPAALLVIAVTVIASALVLPPLRMPDVAADAAASAVYLGNVRFAAQATDYLQVDLDPSPLLHFWSLGVEEQFYLFWPALLLLAAGRRFDRRWIPATVVTVAAVSLALAVIWTSTDAPLAFFLLPARAWELAVGAGLALATARLARIAAPVATAAVIVGLALIGIGAVMFDLGTPFPGTAALLPVAGAALVIAGGLRRPLGPVSAILATPPMQWIGGISYSLYLWHWPVLILPAAAIDAPLPGPVRLALVGLTFVLAAASRRWVEDPIRFGRVARFRPSRALALAGATSLAVAILALGAGRLAGPPGVVQARATPVEVVLPTTAPTSVPSTSGRPGETPSTTSSSAPATRPPTPAGGVPADLVPSLAAVRDDIPVIYADACHAEARETTPGTCVYGDADSSTTVFLVGDSHAAQWFPTFDRLSAEHGWRLVSMTKSACPTADVAVYHTTLKREYTECAAWRAAVVERVRREQPAMVVISDSRGSWLWLDGESVPSTDREDLWAAGLRRAIGSMAAAGSVVVLGDTPNPKGDPPVCLSDHMDDALACATPSSKAMDAERTASERAVAEATGAMFIDPGAWVCPTEPCPVVIGDVLVFRDGHHMTTPFARALAPYLDRLLPALR
jgi:peptidoglycan/LPS O-acetylase OafA/YrhL